MTRIRAFALLALFLLPAPSWARLPKIKDHARLFTAAGIEQAEELLQEIKQQYRKDVIVESFNKVPLHRDPWRKFSKMDAAARDQFLRDWARRDVPGLEGVCVLVYDDPPLRRVQSSVGREVRRQNAFTNADAKELQNLLQGELGAGDNDQALLNALRLIRDRLKERLGGSVAPRPFNWLEMAWIIAGAFGVWLLLVVIQVLRGHTVSPVFVGVNPSGSDGGTVWTAFRAALTPPAGALTPASERDQQHPEPLHDQV